MRSSLSWLRATSRRARNARRSKLCSSTKDPAPDCSPIASLLEGGVCRRSPARRLTEGVVLPQSRRQAAVTDPRPQREPQGGRILSAPTVWRSSGQSVGGASRSARRSPSRRRGGGSACPAGMSPPGGTGGPSKKKGPAHSQLFECAGPFCCDKTGLCREGQAPPAMPSPRTGKVPQCSHWGG